MVHALLEGYQVDVNNVGRVEVGTESMVDKSKAIKTTLMRLFGDNTFIEGADTYNACYGGTSALFNALSWMESSAWDGRLAIVVCGDIALYNVDSAKPTSGGGAVALLIGPNAPIVFEPGMRVTYARDVNDFYKPVMDKPYPIVHGALSLECYLDAVTTTWERLKQVSQRKGTPVTHYSDMNYFMFHAPYQKLVMKGFTRIMQHDALEKPETVSEELRSLFCQRPAEALVTDPVFMREAVRGCTATYAEKVAPSMGVTTRVGNCYTASLYMTLVSLLGLQDPETLRQARLCLFSYGSGFIASMFTCRIVGDVSPIAAVLRVRDRLERRVAVPPIAVDQLALLQEGQKAANFTPTEAADTVRPGAYMLTGINEHYVRQYARV